MDGHLFKSGRALRRAATPFLVMAGLTVGAVGLTQAAQPGHGRVNSLAGAPLEVTVPVNGLTADDLNVLKATIADRSAWAQAGLTLPAPIETLSVSVEPGLTPSSRVLVLRSTQVVDKPVVDILISLTTASGTTPIQSSYLVLAADRAAGYAGTVRVTPGDTLYAIGMSIAVPGADIYQVMWAIYETNLQAFISENMNLLRAGSVLQIPDAATIRQVDPKYARAMFAKHDDAFRARRTTRALPSRVQAVVALPSEAGKVTTPFEAPMQAPAVDQVRLASNNPADLQADERVAAANALNEMQSRVEALQRNVEELRDAIQKSQAVVAGKTAISGAPSQAGRALPSSAGTPGNAGAPGVAGAAGVSGLPGLAGSIGASGVAGATGVTSSTGALSATGASGSMSAPGATSALGATSASGATSAAGATSAIGASGAASAAGASGTAGASVSSSAAGTSGSLLPATGGVAGNASVAQSDSASTQRQLGTKSTLPYTQNTEVVAAKSVKESFTQLKEYASDHVLGFVLGISALLALLIAFLLRRAGRESQKQMLDDEPRTNPGLASDFDQKLQAIDLSLDSQETSSEKKSDAAKTST